MDGIGNQYALGHEDVFADRKLRGASDVTIIANLRAFPDNDLRLIGISGRIARHRVKPAPSSDGNTFKDDMLRIVDFAVGCTRLGT